MLFKKQKDACLCVFFFHKALFGVSVCFGFSLNRSMGKILATVKKIDLEAECVQKMSGKVEFAKTQTTHSDKKAKLRGMYAVKSWEVFFLSVECFLSRKVVFSLPIYCVIFLSGQIVCLWFFLSDHDSFLEDTTIAIFVELQQKCGTLSWQQCRKQKNIVENGLLRIQSLCLPPE